MVAEDDPDNPVRASSSSQCHAQVLKAINKARCVCVCVCTRECKAGVVGSGVILHVFSFISCLQLWLFLLTAILSRFPWQQSFVAKIYISPRK